MYQINSESEGAEGSDIVPEDDEGSQSDDAMDANSGPPGMDNVKTDAEDVKASGMTQQTADMASSSHEPPGRRMQQQSDVGIASSSQHSAASHADELQAVAPNPPAMEQTLPYEAGPSSLPSLQTLPYHLVSGTQHGKAGHGQQADLVDLTDASGSAKKRKQSDIRGFLSPRALQH